MKVVFDHQIFFAQRYGGISRYFRELSMRLARAADMRVSVVAPFHINEYLWRGAMFGLGWPYFGYEFRHAERLRNRARRFLVPRAYVQHRKADIVHETYYSETAFGTGRARVTTVHDMIYEIYPQHFADAAQVTQAKRISVERCDHVICVSEATRHDLVHFFNVAPERTSVIHLGYDLMRASDTPRPELPVAAVASRPYVLFVGHRGLYKNFDRLAEAFAGSNLLHEGFDLVAFGGGALSTAEATLLGRLGIVDRVRHVAGDDALLGRYYRGATMLAFPSLYEGFGIPPLEAMSFDCPVVCSNTSSIPEVVGDAAVFFEPESIGAIRDALERVVASDVLRSELVARGRERLKAFAWQRCAEETAGIYARVLKQAA